MKSGLRVAAETEGGGKFWDVLFQTDSLNQMIAPRREGFSVCSV